MENSEAALVQGLVAADQALDSIRAEQVDFEELIINPTRVWQASGKFCPEITEVKYIDARFEQTRTKILAAAKPKNIKRLQSWWQTRMRNR